MDTPVQRNNPPKCGVCLDNERKKCKEWDSLKCGGKNCPDSSLMCDECQYCFHHKCVGLEEATTLK